MTGPPVLIRPIALIRMLFLRSMPCDRHCSRVLVILVVEVVSSKISVIYLIFHFAIGFATAVIGCAAEANFQACKSIQETLLHGCGPSNYACQCEAQKLIHQCYNLCPEYASDASIQAATVQAICSAVPTTSSLSIVLISASTVIQSSSTAIPSSISTSSTSLNIAVPTQTTNTPSSSITYPAKLQYIATLLLVVVVLQGL
ncbi:hypothetical protein BDB01DRAFT_831021 [Pilobolus umbonatus]|nr:hypothetical protein BDB01DRAFT_831021 [Pilobolus umbonatus]